METMREVASGVAIWAVGAVSAAIIWLVRRVLTNQGEIAILRQELLNREKERNEDRRTVAAIWTEVHAIKNMLIQRGGGQ